MKADFSNEIIASAGPQISSLANQESDRVIGQGRRGEHAGLEFVESRERVGSPSASTVIHYWGRCVNENHSR